MKILAIDPGNTDSAYALIESTTRRPLEVDKISNTHLTGLIPCLAADHQIGLTVIEMVASYGMPVGREVFETCVWIGRFAQVTDALAQRHAQLTYRKDVKLHVCGSTRAKDSNITQALIDRFASGAPNRGKGTKSDPGWFYGFRADIWQAYALAVYAADVVVGVPREVVPSVTTNSEQGALL